MRAYASRIKQTKIGIDTKLKLKPTSKNYTGGSKMKGFCISLDVSKGTSFYQGFKGFEMMDVAFFENRNISRYKKCPNFNLIF